MTSAETFYDDWSFNRFFKPQPRSREVLGGRSYAVRRISVSGASSRSDVQRGSAMSASIQCNWRGLEGVFTAGWNMFATVVLSQRNVHNIVAPSRSRHSLRSTQGNETFPTASMIRELNLSVRSGVKIRNVSTLKSCRRPLMEAGATGRIGARARDLAALASPCKRESATTRRQFTAARSASANARVTKLATSICVRRASRASALSSAPGRTASRSRVSCSLGSRSSTLTIHANFTAPTRTTRWFMRSMSPRMERPATPAPTTCASLASAK